MALPDNAEIHMAAGVESSTGKTHDRRLMCNFLFVVSGSINEDYRSEDGKGK